MDKLIDQRMNLLQSGVLIGKHWRLEASGGICSHVNPTTGKAQQDFPLAGLAEVDEAVAVARAAFRAWRLWDPTERRRVLQRWVELVGRAVQELTTIAALECGTPVALGQHMVGGAVKYGESAALWVDKLASEVLPTARCELFDYTLAEPYGVIGVILTWNGSASGALIQILPALAAGCCVVTKTSEQAPFGVTVIGRLALEAGIPPGVLNILPGDGKAGAALVAHPGIDKVSFTGGAETARAIAGACSRALKPMLFELGGKSANIVFEDANLPKTAAWSARGITGLTGQACTAPTRLLVQNSLYDRFVPMVMEILENVSIGDPMAPATTMGPVISQAACDRILGIVSRAQAEGAGQLVLGGERLNGPLADGYFIPPTVFGNVKNASELAQREAFGPLLSVIRFSDEAEAIEIANDTEFGLSGYVHTADISRALRISGALEVGAVGINGGIAMGSIAEAPFGGCKASGYGRQGGKWALLEFMRVKNVMIDLS